eukprot:9503891-Pyramimonas_sp.AAC.1
MEAARAPAAPGSLGAKGAPLALPAARHPRRRGPVGLGLGRVLGLGQRQHAQCSRSIQHCPLGLVKSLELLALLGLRAAQLDLANVGRQEAPAADAISRADMHEITRAIGAPPGGATPAMLLGSGLERLAVGTYQLLVRDRLRNNCHLVGASGLRPAAPLLDALSSSVGNAGQEFNWSRKSSAAERRRRWSPPRARSEVLGSDD